MWWSSLCRCTSPSLRVTPTLPAEVVDGLSGGCGGCGGWTGRKETEQAGAGPSRRMRLGQGASILREGGGRGAQRGAHLWRDAAPPQPRQREQPRVVPAEHIPALLEGRKEEGHGRRCCVRSQHRPARPVHPAPCPLPPHLSVTRWLSLRLLITLWVMLSRLYSHTSGLYVPSTCSAQRRGVEAGGENRRRRAECGAGAAAAPAPAPLTGAPPHSPPRAASSKRRGATQTPGCTWSG